jgi:polysaccharide export outer membrane protein
LLLWGPPAQAQRPAAAAVAAAPAEYRLGAGDVIRIAVFQNADLTLETRITEAGVVSYPLLGALGVTKAGEPIADRSRDRLTLSRSRGVRPRKAGVLVMVKRLDCCFLAMAGIWLSNRLALTRGSFVLAGYR